MKTKLNSLFVNALIVLMVGSGLVVAGSVLLMPSETEAIEGCPNPSCGSNQYTPTVTGVSGADCMWAEMDAHNKANAYVSCGPDGVCTNVLEIIESCVLEYGVWKVRARVRYQCASCF